MIAEENLARTRVLRLQDAQPPPVRNLSLAVLTGALMALAFPGWEAWILAWVALAPLLAAVVRERSAARAFGFGWLAGSVFFYASCWWITFPPITYAGFFPPLAWVLAVVPCAISGLFFGGFAVTTHTAFRRLGPYALLAAPLIWVASEWLRLETMGVGWNMLGYALAFQPLLVQSANLGGVYAVSFLLASTATTLAFVLVAPSRRASSIAMAGTLVLFLGNIVYGVATMPAAATAEGGLELLAVQPDIEVLGPEATADDVYEAHREALERLGRLSAPAEGVAPVDIVVWPEIPVGIQFEDDALARWIATRAAASNDGHVLVNALGVTGGDGHTNSAILVGPDGTMRGQYDKVRLLPFGEYVPLREVIPFVDRVPALAGDFTPGDSVHLLEVEGARLGISICFESSFPELAREARRAGASAFVNLTNDAWFGPTPEPRQHLAHAVMRSIETRTPQARVTNAGYSALVDAGGRVVDVTPLFEETTRRWSLPREPLHAETVFTRFGDWLPITALVATTALLAASLARRRRPVIEID